jgi:hypothetical protein
MDDSKKALVDIYINGYTALMNICTIPIVDV